MSHQPLPEQGFPKGLRGTRHACYSCSKARLEFAENMAHITNNQGYHKQPGNVGKDKRRSSRMASETREQDPSTWHAVEVRASSLALLARSMLSMVLSASPSNSVSFSISS